MKKYFENVKTMKELKTLYRQLTKKWHPDLGGDNDIMAAINVEYETAFEMVKRLEMQAGNKEAKHWQKNDAFRKIINDLVLYPEITIELVGSWIWISGNSYPVKDQLKELGFKFSGSKKKWYWFNGIDKKRRKKGSGKTYNQIKEEYGSEKIKSAEKVLRLAN